MLLAVDRGGYASDLLLARSVGLDSRDAGLAAEIVFGALRFQLQLDFLIEHYSGRAAKLDTEVRVALRIGIYQLRYLDRIPAHAAVGESVELIKRARKRSATGFANAVLRKVNRQPVAWPSRAVELSHPEWLLARWDAQFGVEIATAIARANLRPPEMYVRSPHAAPAGAYPTEIPGCYRVASGQTGACRIQDIGSQSIVPLLELHPGLTFLDLCASPGNKTAQALEYGVRAIACDTHFSRMEPLRTLGIPRVVLDGSSPLPFRRPFDRILLDAPCSGTGTLSRNPEIKWRLRPEDIEDLRSRQSALLWQAREALAPGGILVYSTCALEREENEDVVGDLAARIVRRTPGRDPGDGFFAAVVRQA